MIKNKIGFLCPSADILFHYEPVFKHLPMGSFEVVATDYADSFLASLTDLPHAYAHPLMTQNVKYKVTLSHYYQLYYDAIQEGQVTGDKIYLPQLLGQTNVRLMYALGKDYWNYGDWNSIYDHHLCFGPWQAERLSSFGSQIHQVGYPRYDAYFNQDSELALETLKKRLNLTLDKPCLVWLPTRTQHTLNEFMSQVAQLADKYNIIVKPHPATLEEEPELVEKLRDQPFLTLTETIDNLLLMALADIVICDYGGPPFGAVYLDKNLLLLDHPETQSFELKDYPFELDHSATIKNLNPSELYLRQYIDHLGPEQDISAHLESQIVWENQKQQRADLREIFFASSFGTSGKQAADILLGILQK